jgi:hypothetical protein
MISWISLYYIHIFVFILWDIMENTWKIEGNVGFTAQDCLLVWYMVTSRTVTYIHDSWSRGKC